MIKVSGHRTRVLFVQHGGELYLLSADFPNLQQMQIHDSADCILDLRAWRFVVMPLTSTPASILSFLDLYTYADMVSQPYLRPTVSSADTKAIRLLVCCLGQLQLVQLGNTNQCGPRTDGYWRNQAGAKLPRGVYLAPQPSQRPR